MTISARDIAAQPADGAAGRRRGMAAALAIAALVPPVALLAAPAGLTLLGPAPAAVSLLAALILAPVAVGAVTALIGLEPVRRNFARRSDREHEHLMLRVLVSTLLLLYATGATTLAVPDTRGAEWLTISAIGSIAAWLFLLHLILRPAPSAARRHAAVVVDAIVLSTFLYFGGSVAAGWYPLYLASAFYAGVRLGLGALAVSAAAGTAGFVLSGVLSPFWQQQPLLLAGLAAALTVLPAFAGFSLRAVAALRAEASAAVATRDRFLAIIGRGLREPVEAMMRLDAEVEAEASPRGPPAHALLSQIEEVLDLATIEAGAFAPAVESFDLHALINDAVARLRPAAARQGVALAVRLDPALPYRLRGWPRQLTQIVNSIVVEAIGDGSPGTIRVDLAAAGGDGGGLRLRLVVRDHAGETAAPSVEVDADPLVPDAPAQTGAPWRTGFTFAVVRRLVELMGGRITLAEAPEQGRRWTVILPLALDQSAAEGSLDLGRRPVLLVTEDAQLAGELAEPLNGWNADTRWIGGLDDALVYVERCEMDRAPILVVDGRSRILPALSFVHRAMTMQAEPPFVLFIAEAGQVGSLAELGDGELTGLLPAPCTDRMLEAALHALPLAQGAPAPVPLAAEPIPAGPAPEAEEVDDRVTPIAAHPRFGTEISPPVDSRVVASLRAFDGDFLPELVQSFRADANLLIDRLDSAAVAGDAVSFARALQALRRSAAALGGTRLCELAQSLREVNGVELRQHGAAIMQRLAGELARLDAALVEFIPVAAERQR